MSRESLVVVIGLVVFFTAFSGFPREWEEIIYIASGIVLMIIGYSLRRTAFFRSIDQDSGERISDAFVESPSASEETQENEESRKE